MNQLAWWGGGRGMLFGGGQKNEHTRPYTHMNTHAHKFAGAQLCVCGREL